MPEYCVDLKDGREICFTSMEACRGYELQVGAQIARTCHEKPEPSPPTPPEYEEVTVTVLVDPPGAGRTYPSVGVHTRPYGYKYMFTATPFEGFTFKQWNKNGARISISSQTSVIMSETMTLTAVFEGMAPPAPTTGSLTITVQDTETGQTLSGASVTIDGLTRFTDGQGKVYFEDLQPKVYDVTITMAGYMTGRHTATVTLDVGRSYTMPLTKETDPGMFAPLISFLKGVPGLFLGALRGLTDAIGASVKPMVQGIVDQLSIAMGAESPEEPIEESVKVATEKYLKRIKDLTDPIYKGSPELEVAAANAGQLLTALLGVVVTVEGSATVADNVQPFRGAGIPDVARSFMRTLGLYGLASEVATMPAKIGMLSALEYYYNREFTPRIPALPDLITMLVREVIDIKEYTEYAAWHGESAKWAANRWEAHWRLPARGAITDAYHRGVLTAEERDKYYVWHDFKPEKRPGITKSDIAIIAGIEKTLIPRVDLRRGWEFGVVTDEELDEGYIKLGYEDDAERMASIQRSVALAGERAAVARAAGRLFRDGRWTASRFIKELEDLGYPEQIRTLWRRRYELERLAKAKGEEEETVEGAI